MLHRRSRRRRVAAAISQARQGFLNRVFVITSKDANLTKAHGRYLESKLIALATSAGGVTVENSTTPGAPALPEADAFDMDYLLSQLQIVLPVLGVNAIRVPAPPEPGKAEHPMGPPVFHLRQAKRGVDASAQQIDGEFTMSTGSTVVPSWHGVVKADSTLRRTTRTAPTISILSTPVRSLPTTGPAN